MVDMTYSQKVKNELCSAHFHCSGCKYALIYAMLMVSRGIRENRITLNVENKSIADIFATELVELTGAIVTTQSPNLNNAAKKAFYLVSIDDEKDTEGIIRFFFGNIGNKHIIDKSAFLKPCCEAAFLRGAFLVCGTIINPQKEYHLEFSLSSEKLAIAISEMLLNAGFEFKTTMRANSYLLYIKDSEQIEDIITYLGAPISSLELMNLKIEKEVRNNINRKTNCETGNIGKTVNASMEQIEKIKKIKNSIGLEELPLELQDVALLRLLNPEASLNELCMLMGNKISKSGLNHRLKKLMEISDKL